MKEAARVLRSGGIAAWSVWGRDEESPLFTTVPRYGARRHHAAAAAERREIAILEMGEGGRDLTLLENPTASTTGGCGLGREAAALRGGPVNVAPLRHRRKGEGAGGRLAASRLNRTVSDGRPSEEPRDFAAGVAWSCGLAGCHRIRRDLAVRNRSASDAKP